MTLLGGIASIICQQNCFCVHYVSYLPLLQNYIAVYRDFLIIKNKPIGIISASTYLSVNVWPEILNTPFYSATHWMTLLKILRCVTSGLACP